MAKYMLEKGGDERKNKESACDGNKDEMNKDQMNKEQMNKTLAHLFICSSVVIFFSQY